MLQEAQPHKAEAVAVSGKPVTPTHPSSVISLEDLAASLRLEHVEAATALLKTREVLHEQAWLQRRQEEKEAAQAEAAAAAQRAKPKVLCLPSL